MFLHSFKGAFKQMCIKIVSQCYFFFRPIDCSCNEKSNKNKKYIGRRKTRRKVHFWGPFLHLRSRKGSNRSRNIKTPLFFDNFGTPSTHCFVKFFRLVQCLTVCRHFKRFSATKQTVSKVDNPETQNELRSGPGGVTTFLKLQSVVHNKTTSWYLVVLPQTAVKTEFFHL